MQLTLNIPSFKSLKESVTSHFATETAPAEKPLFGCMLNRDTNTWIAYWNIDGIVHYELPPEGMNAKVWAQAQLEKGATASDNYPAECAKCHGTGKIHPGPKGKCYSCDGKGWMSPIDLVRKKNYEARKAS